MRYDNRVNINNREISFDQPVYFIADIAANHDGDLERAKELIWMAKEAGADAAKFQHFKADKIVSDYGFEHLDGQLSHQSSWKQSVFETYRQYECNRDWNQELALTAQKAGIDFMTTPYDYEAVELLDPYIPAYKIGSGDITWTDFIGSIAKKNKPVILATGASDMVDVERAVDTILEYNRQLVLLQCNTNYTGSLENFKYVNLNVLRSYSIRYPQMILGLSDHTPGHSTVLGAVALGARVIEKHFTDDNARTGPDHPFSMNPKSWYEMMERCREVEASMGTGIKSVENNESETVVIQRRCIRLNKDLEANKVITEADIEVLRPAPKGALQPYEAGKAIGRTLKGRKLRGEALYETDLI
ncbi:N-acetylneuraminate synthase family protein [Paenibacillus chibensis]|uniref:N-acetylneuraminate synthase family protein n=1 Tax=Paenibacillus chibensis TaxID=59846 RepID=A0ABU6PVQ1_9BACL|nr:N-acetylneuraminate synthase family protein [Paenibacillus chibensis]